MALVDQFDAPIPGENYTSDTKNYPWHRPPDFDDLDDAIEFCFKKLNKKEATFGLMTMFDMGLPLTVAARTFVLSGVGSGRWTPDFAILLAGPVARIMQSIAKVHGIKVELGFDTSLPPTKAFLEGISRKPTPVSDAPPSVTLEEVQAEAEEKLPTSGKNAKGFMSRGAKPVEEEVI